VQYNAEQIDERGEFDPANNRWICQVPGVYEVFAQVRFGNISAGSPVAVEVRRNDVQISVKQSRAGGSGDSCFDVSDLVACNAGDIIEIILTQISGSTQTITADSALSYMTIRAAK
jgi:hypothetical protein